MTVTATVPSMWTGVTAVIEVELLKVTEVAGARAEVHRRSVGEVGAGQGDRRAARDGAAGGRDRGQGRRAPVPAVMVKLTFEMSKKMLLTQETRIRACVVGVFGIVTVCGAVVDGRAPRAGRR